jgi:hypothetical protein
MAGRPGRETENRMRRKGFSTQDSLSLPLTRGTIKKGSDEVYEAEFLIVNQKTDSFGA